VKLKESTAKSVISKEGLKEFGCLWGRKNETCLDVEQGKIYFLRGVDRRRLRRATECEDQQRRLQELLQRRINQRSEYLAKNVIVDCSYARSFTPRQKFADQAMFWENIFVIWSA
jgi:hypothetical protein